VAGKVVAGKAAAKHPARWPIRQGGRQGGGRKASGKVADLATGRQTNCWLAGITAGSWPAC
jgi:hypothetical protein